MSELDEIFDAIHAGDAASAAKRRWNPSRTGEIDIRIAADGTWYHDGRAFRRDALVRLFASVLRREGDDYFLVTPAEKLRIRVDDAPFTAGLVERIDDGGRAAILFTTSTGERIPLDADHPLRVETDPDTGEPRPYLRVRDGLDALIGRGAFYDLVQLADESERGGRRILTVESLGQTFELGSIDD